MKKHSNFLEKYLNEVILPTLFHSREMWILLFWRCLQGWNVTPSSLYAPAFWDPGTPVGTGLAGDNSKALTVACLCEGALWVSASSSCIGGHYEPSGVHLSAPGRWPQKFWSWKGKDTHCRGRKAISWHGRRLKEELCGFGPEQVLRGWVWPATSGEISLWGPLILGTDE